MSELSNGRSEKGEESSAGLDRRASAVLLFNAMMLAVMSAWLGYIPLNYMHLLLDFVFLAVLWSCYLLLVVLWHDRGAEQRLDQFRRAWQYAAVSLLSVLVLSAFHTVGTVLTATGSCTRTCQVLFSERYFGNATYPHEDKATE